MRNNKNIRVLAILMAMVAATVLFGGCAPKVKADESVKILAKGTLTLDFTDFDKIGMKKEDQEKLKNSTLNLAKLQIKNMLMAVAQIKINDEQAQKIIDKTYEVQKKSAISTKLLSEEGKLAVVELSIQPLDGEKMSADMEALAEQKVQEMSPEEVEKQAAAIITEVALEALDKAEFKAEPAVFKVKCKLSEKENQWIPEEDSINFGARLGYAMWGMEME